MPVAQLPPTSLCGLSFAIADLILLRSWAHAQSLQMTIHLDHGIEGEEYEEVIAFSKGEGVLCQWIMWRNATTVFLQPLIGRTQRYDSVVDALEALAAKQPLKLTDIQAKDWPL